MTFTIYNALKRFNKIKINIDSILLYLYLKRYNRITAVDMNKKKYGADLSAVPNFMIQKNRKGVNRR